MSKVHANGRSMIHKGDGLVDTCAVPDVCKTPSPGGPVPIPYVNVAQDGDLAAGSTSVSIDGNPIALKSSNLSTSSGDEPGTAGGGLVSSKTKGKLTWANASIDVKIEGKGVVRFLDPTQHNGNTFNTAFTQQGGTGFAYGDDPSNGDIHCPRDDCRKPKAEHVMHETFDVRDKAGKLIQEMERLRKLPGNLGFLKNDAYMLGILTCKCGKVFAAMSGEKNLTGFEEAVKNLGWTACGPVDFAKMHDRSGRIPDSKELFAEGPVFENSPKRGVCAAPKLIQQALRDGHQPVHMSERLYAPLRPGKKNYKDYTTITYQHIIINTKTGRFKKSWERPTVFTHGATAPSCDTCKYYLTPMLCGDKNTPCS